MRRVIKNADYALVAHKSLGTLVRQIDKKIPIEVIPYGVDTDFFKPKRPNQKIAEKLGIDKDNPIVAFSGHIIEDKGLDTLIQSAPIVLKNHDNVKFLIIGDGPARSKAESLVKEMKLRGSFRFVGFVPQEKVIEYLSIADICVAPYKPRAWFKISLPETPLKVVEYMALGKPVVMSKISSENIVTWSNCGFLVEPDDANELASNLISLIEDAKLRTFLGKKGRRYIEDNLSWSRIAEKLLTIYRSVSSA